MQIETIILSRKNWFLTEAHLPIMRSPLDSWLKTSAGVVSYFDFEYQLALQAKRDKLNWHFSQFVLKNMIFCVQTMPNKGKLYTKSKLPKRLVDTYYFEVQAMTVEGEIATQSCRSHMHPSPVIFLANHRQQRNGSWQSSPKEFEYAPYLLEEGPFPAKCWGEALWGRSYTHVTPRCQWQLGGCWPKDPSFGTFWVHHAGACQWMGLWQFWTSRADFEEREREREREEENAVNYHVGSSKCLVLNFWILHFHLQSSWISILALKFQILTFFVLFKILKLTPILKIICT